MKKRDPAIIKVVYTGRRLMSDNKVWQRFEVKGSGKERFFKGVKGVYIGYTYESSPKNIAKRPERTDDEKIINPKWEALDAIVDAHKEKRRAEAKYQRARSPSINAAIQSITPLVKGLGYLELSSLIEHIIDRASRLVNKK